jgi:hypothetical protein
VQIGEYTRQQAEALDTLYSTLSARLGVRNAQGVTEFRITADELPMVLDCIAGQAQRLRTTAKLADKVLSRAPGLATALGGVAEFLGGGQKPRKE